MKKGFTLIELLSVIIILGIIIAITIPTVSNIISNNRNKLYLENERRLLVAGQDYLVENSELLPTVVGNTIKVEVADLITNNNIDVIPDLKDSSQTCDGYVLIRKSEDSYEVTPFLDCPNYTSGTIIQDGLILDMPLGDNITGSTFLDLQGNYSGVDTSTTEVVNRFGDSNKATGFNGTTSQIRLPESNTIIDDDTFTISAWFNATAIGSVAYENRIITFQRNTTTSTGFSLTLGADNLARIMYADAGTTHRYVDYTISLSTWYNIVATYDGTTYKLYIDGNLVAQQNDTFQGISTGYAYIGGYAASSYIFNGYIDDLKVYDRVLNDDEVMHNYTVEVNKSVE